MSFRFLTDSYAVSPQIGPDEVAALRNAGFVRVICNRPDGEIPPDLQSDVMRAAVEAAGMEFVVNEIVPGDFSSDVVSAQADAMAAHGPVFAYCGSGRRSSIAWAMAQAGKVPADELIARAARWGYDLEPFRPQIS